MSGASNGSANPGSNCTNYLVGQDQNGQWVVRDKQGLCGGLFISKREAMRYALLETGNRPDHVTIVQEPIEIRMTGGMKAL
jgi:hypothetical protein